MAVVDRTGPGADGRDATSRETADAKDVDGGPDVGVAGSGSAPASDPEAGGGGARDSGAGPGPEAAGGGATDGGGAASPAAAGGGSASAGGRSPEAAHVGSCDWHIPAIHSLEISHDDPVIQELMMAAATFEGRRRVGGQPPDDPKCPVLHLCVLRQHFTDLGVKVRGPSAKVDVLERG